MQPGYATPTVCSVILLVFMLFSSAAVGQSPARELIILNWSEYLDPDLIREFEQQHNARIREVYFESDDIRDEILVETGGTGYDLTIVNGVMVESYRKRGWLAPATIKQIPNLKHIDDDWLNAFEGVRGQAVPYFWGTLGIAYRSDLVETPPRSWMDLYRPARYLRGRIAMLESQRDAMGMALKALGYSANSIDSREIRESTDLLLAQKPFVKTYTYIVLDENSALVSGDVYMAMMFSGDALMVQEYNDNITYVIPREGSNVWGDYIAILQGSKNKELAYAFVNFLHEPENAARLAEYVYYATPNKAAEKLLPAEFLQHPVIYPGKEVLEKSEAYQPLAPRALKKRNSGFARLMQ